MSTRPVQPMPDDVHRELEEHDVFDAYQQRPFYQRNDYLAWIGRAKKIETRRRRIEQMLAELERGGIYMAMDHPPSREN
ncbi:MAG: YdeI/OmpD-associated family protein [Acidimicrobiia bacterium]|nr:MAG: YdeI/OmpD-associated family protein [Acidimicrobiia bacterium]